jgi:heme oxygenase
MSSLKELTAEKHKEAETQPFIKSIFSNKVDENKYIDYLYQLKIIYDYLETTGDRLGLFDDLENLKRHSAISLDYAELSKNRINLNDIRNSTIDYLEYLDSIKDDKDKIMAHVYVRHMGDLFGGQALAKLLPGPNNMFKFEDIPSLAMKVRSKLDISMADEANRAFDFNIEMIKEYND